MEKSLKIVVVEYLLITNHDNLISHVDHAHAYVQVTSQPRDLVLQNVFTYKLYLYKIDSPLLYIFNSHMNFLI